MAFDNPPFVMDATTVDGEVIRRALGSMISPAGGLITAGDLQVTQNGTPNMTVNIGLGQIWVPGSSTTSQGLYYSRNAASISQAINAANATNPRIDTVYAQVQDAAYAGSNKQFGPGYQPGTATAGANLSNLTGKGAVPASSYVLAYVLVPANATSIVTADILNVAASAILNLAPQNPRTLSSSGTANPGDVINVGGTITVTLPTVSASTPILPITLNNTSAPGSGSLVTVTSGSTINGGGMSGVTSFPLGPGSTITVLPNVGVNWFVVAGQQDSGWVALGSVASGFTTATGSYPPAARKLGSVVSLSGGYVNHSGSTFTGTVAVLPSGMAPNAAVVYATDVSGTPGIISIDTSGNLLFNGLVNNGSITVDGLSFPIR